MSFINLLPWREEARKRLRQRYLRLLTGIALCCLSAMAVFNSLVHAQIAELQTDNAVLHNTVAELQVSYQEHLTIQQQNDSLQQQIAELSGLYSRRYRAAAVISEIARVVPDELALNMLELKQDQLLLSGQSDRHLMIAELLKQTEASAFFATVSPESIQAEKPGGRHLNRFRIRLKLADMDTMLQSIE
ncbi:PilN domain-containing protein [Chromatiaceae bacterium AAb-1]|nr:PilN domain-containing protein [Chromatiaceae bacterium AAb-1]